jgi:hypothetical protein
MVIAGLAIWWVVSHWTRGWNKIDRWQSERNSTGSEVKLERWTYTWRLPEGRTENGRNSFPLDLEITRNDREQLWATFHSQYERRDIRLGGLCLNKVGRDLIGTWSNYLDGDSGSCFLYYKAPGVWSGPAYSRYGSSQADVTIRRTIE